MIQLRQTVRRLLKSPGFTLTTVLTLAIGIGTTTAIFSVVNGILIKPLPFPESDRLLALVHTMPSTGDLDGASPAIYFTYRDHNRTFESVALWVAAADSITGSGDPEEVQSLHVTHEFLSALGVQPALGRTFSEMDDTPGSPKTVILSHGYWQRRFGGSANVLGETLVVAGAPHVVIGVLPQEFRFGQQPAAILTPMQPNRAFAYVGPIGERGIARLKESVTLAEANADARRMLAIMLDTFPLVPGISREMTEGMQLGPNLQPLKATIVGYIDEVLWLLMGTIGMLLLIACANVANLQLVRTEGRSQELAIQAALGAGRGRIAGTLLLESVLLGLAGGAVGVALAVVSLPVLLSAAAADLPNALEVAIDPAVLAFAVAISLGTGLLFGLIPAVKYGAHRVAAALRDGGRSHSLSRERHRARNSLVVIQVALALVLLIASGLMIRTFQSLRQVDPGFSRPEQIQTVNISIPEAAVPDFARVIRMQNDIQDRLSEIAGVEAAAFTTWLPLSTNGPSWGHFFDDKPLPVGVTQPVQEFRYTSPNFFETLGTPLVAGRTFEWADYDGRPLVALVSESLARREWGTPEAALGKRVRSSEAVPWQEIVGVVGDVHHEGLELPAPDTVYLTLREGLAQYLSRMVTFVIRSERVGTAGFLQEVQQAIWSVNGNLPLGSVQTLGAYYERSMARTSLTLVLLAITGAMALLLGVIGIYGVIGYMVSQRTREIGIRIALGAQNSKLTRMFMSQVLVIVFVGIVVGIAGATILTRLMESLLFGVTALDPATYVVVAAILVAAAALAGYLPARRATRVDPIRALRAE
jgi:predicted permease